MSDRQDRGLLPTTNYPPASIVGVATRVFTSSGAVAHIATAPTPGATPVASTAAPHHGLLGGHHNNNHHLNNNNHHHHRHEGEAVVAATGVGAGAALGADRIQERVEERREEHLLRKDEGLPRDSGLTGRTDNEEFATRAEFRDRNDRVGAPIVGGVHGGGNSVGDAAMGKTFDEPVYAGVQHTPITAQGYMPSSHHHHKEAAATGAAGGGLLAGILGGHKAHNNQEVVREHELSQHRPDAYGTAGLPAAAVPVAAGTAGAVAAAEQPRYENTSMVNQPTSVGPPLHGAPLHGAPLHGATESSTLGSAVPATTSTTPIVNPGVKSLDNSNYDQYAQHGGYPDETTRHAAYKAGLMSRDDRLAYERNYLHKAPGQEGMLGAVKELITPRGYRNDGERRDAYVRGIMTPGEREAFEREYREQGLRPHGYQTEEQRHDAYVRGLMPVSDRTAYERDYLHKSPGGVIGKIKEAVTKDGFKSEADRRDAFEKGIMTPAEREAYLADQMERTNLHFGAARNVGPADAREGVHSGAAGIGGVAATGGILTHYADEEERHDAYRKGVMPKSDRDAYERDYLHNQGMLGSVKAVVTGHGFKNNRDRRDAYIRGIMTPAERDAYEAEGLHLKDRDTSSSSSSEDEDGSKRSRKNKGNKINNIATAPLHNTATKGATAGATSTASSAMAAIKDKFTSHGHKTDPEHEAHKTAASAGLVATAGAMLGNVFGKDDKAAKADKV